MQIDKKYKLEKVVSKDPAREHLQNIWITKHHAFATNGMILAAIPIAQDKDDTAGWLSADALKLARKQSSTDDIRIELNGVQKLPDGTTLLRPDDSNTFQKIAPILMRSYRHRKSSIALNARLLKDLADALGTEEIVLEIGKSSDEALLVRSMAKGNDARGLIMPIRMNP